MPLFDFSRNKDDERKHEASVNHALEFTEAFKTDRWNKPIVVKDNGQQAESCDDVCPNMGKCDNCDLEF